MGLFKGFIYWDSYNEKTGKLVEKHFCFFNKVETLGQQWLLLDKYLYDYHKTSQDETHGYIATSFQNTFKFWLYLLKPSLSEVMMALLRLYTSYISCFSNLSLTTISGKIIIDQQLLIFIENVLFKLQTILSKFQTAKTLAWRCVLSEKPFRPWTKQILILAIIVDDLFLLWLALCETLMKMQTILQANNEACHTKCVCIASFLKGLYTEFSSSIFSLKRMSQVFISSLYLANKKLN